MPNGVDGALDSLRHIEAYLISSGFMTSIVQADVSIRSRDPAVPSITTAWRLTWYSNAQKKLAESGKMSAVTGEDGETLYTLESGGFPANSSGS